MTYSIFPKSRLERLEIEMLPFHLKNLCNELVTAFRVGQRLRVGVTLTLEYEGDVPEIVRGDDTHPPDSLISQQCCKIHLTRINNTMYPAHAR